MEKVASSKPPFRINLRGVAVDVQEAMPSSTGAPMRNFKLVDPNGNFLMIRQLGFAATDEEVRDQARVTVYYITGKAAWREGEHGSLWAYENAYTLVDGPAALPVRARKEVVVLG